MQICPFSKKLQIPREFMYKAFPLRLSEAEIRKIVLKLQRKQAKDERAQNATTAEETRSNHSKRDPWQRNLSQALRIRSLSRKRYASTQMRPLSKKCHLGAQKTIPFDEIAPGRSECEPCRINCIWALIIRNTAEIILRTNIGFVTLDSCTKYCSFTCEILKKSHWERT